ncbi:hypothetical protein H5410_014739 [Solanum commersonii]|uniref:Uncharacterized protein n=1 Tax=Solanum commersonii TaxID=4109 RepID=A0A9J5ZS37_SOLCO|nr:hypothetical protein H5410_014739 [Solanum commersonii]
MLAGHVRRRLTNVSDHGRQRRPRDAKDDEARPRLTLVDRCVRAMDYAGRPRPTSADRCVHATNYAARPCPIPTYRCVQATDDAVMARLTSSGRCELATADSGSPCPTSTDRCVQAASDVRTALVIAATLVHCLPLAAPFADAHATSDASRPWLMLPVLAMSPGRCATYPRMMSAGLGCCRMSLVDVVYSMRTYHVRCVLALAGDAGVASGSSYQMCLCLG